MLRVLGKEYEVRTGNKFGSTAGEPPLFNKYNGGQRQRSAWQPAGSASLPCAARCIPETALVAQPHIPYEARLFQAIA